MKRRFFAAAVLAAVLLTGLAACKKNNGGGNPSLNTNLPSGSWKVTYFFDKKDETAHFDGYSFEFLSNGSASATKSGQVTPGSWADGDDDSTPKLYLDFGASSPFDELTEDWEIISISDTKMELRHTSGGNGDTDLLTFEKI